MDSNDPMVQYMKMAFVFRAVEDGWTVSKVAADRYKFSRLHNGVVEEYTTAEFIRDFIQKFLPSFG